MALLESIGRGLEIPALEDIGFGLSALGQGYAGKGPGLMGAFEERQKSRDQDQNIALFQDMSDISNLIHTKNYEGAKDKSFKVMEGLIQAERSPKELTAISEALEKGDYERALNLSNAEIQEGVIEGYGKDSKILRQYTGMGSAEADRVKGFQPVTLINPLTNEKRLVMPTISQSGKTELSPLTIPEGFVVSKETAAEKRAGNRLANIKDLSDKQSFEYMEKGQVSADSMAVMYQITDLLGEVETGGFEGVAIKAQNLLGISSADEAELTNLMGKRVLSELRPTFGAQFTEREGALLISMEANLGKSVVGNKRIIRRALDIAKRNANRGIEAAIAVKDYKAAARIQDAMDFRLGAEDIQESGALPEITTQAEFDALPPGASYLEDGKEFTK